jgi:hypothetical protein
MSLFGKPTWKQIIKKAASDVEFSNSAEVSLIESTEKALGIQLPQVLRELLLESDGVKANYGSEIIWSVTKIQQQNLLFRSDADFKKLYMPFDHLLFFGGDSGGDQFAFAIHADGKIHKHDIFRWKHESDERVWLANSLQVLFERKAFK